MPQKALEALVYDQLDTVIFQVRSERDEIIDGAAELPAPPAIAPGEHVFFDGTYRGAPIRVAALHAPNGFVVQVGETLNKRNRLVREILLAELVPTLLIARGVDRARMVRRRARAASARAHARGASRALAARPAADSTRPACPGEIAPVVEAFNGLLAHLRDASTLQQRFLANAAHQLRTPLAGLQMHLELLLRRELPADVRIGGPADAQRDRSRGPPREPAARAGQGRERAGSRAGRWRSIDLMAVGDAAARDWFSKAIARKIDLGFALEPALIEGDPLLHSGAPRQPDRQRAALHAGRRRGDGRAPACATARRT